MTYRSIVKGNLLFTVLFGGLDLQRRRVTTEEGLEGYTYKFTRGLMLRPTTAFKGVTSMAILLGNIGFQSGIRKNFSRCKINRMP